MKLPKTWLVCVAACLFVAFFAFYPKFHKHPDNLGCVHNVEANKVEGELRTVDTEAKRAEEGELRTVDTEAKRAEEGELRTVDTEAKRAEEGDFRVINMTQVSPLVQVARRIQLRHGAVMFCMINDAYFDFAASWGCNTAPLDVHRHVLFLTTDVTTGQRLKSLWPEVSVVALDPPQFSGFRSYSRAGHVRMMTERTRFILRLLEAGVPLLLFEVDCLWLKDPLPFLQPFHAAADIVGTRVNTVKPVVVAAGFLLLHPTPATVQFWRKLTDDLDQLVASFKKLGNTNSVSEAKNEQQFFTNLARKQYAGINISYVPNALFPDGKWYSLPEKKRRESRPVLINNNWVIGKDGKRGRAKAFGHWFWDEAQGKCNATAVNRLFH